MNFLKWAYYVYTGIIVFGNITLIVDNEYDIFTFVGMVFFLLGAYLIYDLDKKK